ncbi:hypothetical protein IMZ48_20135 [Candidatus Bathyarchaeota archaeon]|nr:hypothetical protein [Candidatus Bathyarchaeota archaeon]
MAQHAEEHNYHIAIAMPPIDGWYIHPPTASLFKKYNERLSLLIHGNNHVKEELAKPLSESGMNTMIAQALKRTASFEKRSGIAISRVMAAPHGHCSEEMMKKMLFLGFEAATISKPYPWLPRPPQDRALAGWNPAEFVAGGFPVLPRFRFADSTDDLSLRTFLDQPLIMYGHHSDLASGLEILEKLADKVNRFENVNWISLQEMARSNYVTQKEGSVLTIVMYSRRIRIRIPLDIDHIIVEIPSSHDSIEQELIAIRKSSDPDLKIISGRPFVPIPITISGPVDVSLVRSKYGDPANYPNPPFYAWPIIRRILTEGRDRLAPILTA